MIGNGDRQMRFSTPIFAFVNNESLRMPGKIQTRLFCVFQRCLNVLRVASTERVGTETVKSLVAIGLQIAVAALARVHFSV